MVSTRRAALTGLPIFARLKAFNPAGFDRQGEQILADRFQLIEEIN
jgi:hypothetical protein